ncbi:MAG: hypothetical protein NDJ89_13380 [Oligoflexia bacterium]|nr:hypothetical protein [Oligoflexia bacterium]
MSNIIVAVLCLIALTQVGYAGTEAGNGGQDVAAQFVQAAYGALNDLDNYFTGPENYCRYKVYASLCELDRVAVRGAISEAKVLAVPSLVEQDPNTGELVEYAALNFPEQKLIKVSIAYWKRPTSCVMRKMNIAFHEFLGVMRLEETTYQYSSLLRNWWTSNHGMMSFKGCEEERGTGSGP